MYSRVYVEITNICNMNCSFCHGHSRPLRQMTEEEYAHILKQLTGKTQYLYHHLMADPGAAQGKHLPAQLRRQLSGRSPAVSAQNRRVCGKSQLGRSFNLTAALEQRF